MTKQTERKIMADIRQVTDTFAVSPQLSEEDFTQIAAGGFKLVVCNRPDGEAPDQMTAAQAAAAASAQGLAFRALPFVKVPGEAEVEAMAAILQSTDDPIFAYCRTGTRSIFAWALASVQLGRETPDSALRKGLAAGYDLTPIHGLMTGM